MAALAIGGAPRVASAALPKSNGNSCAWSHHGSVNEADWTCGGGCVPAQANKSCAIDVNEGAGAVFCNCHAPGGGTFGDPNFLTRDGLMYAFHMTGDFILVDMGPSFAIHMRQEAVPGRPSLAWNTAAALRLGATRLNLYTNPLRLSVNGVPTPMTDGEVVALPQGDTLFRYGSSVAGASIVINRPTGERVEIKMVKLYEVESLSLHVNATGPGGGLLGDGDGDPANDLRIRGTDYVLSWSTTFYKFYTQFGESWRVPPAESLFDDVLVIGAAGQGSAAPKIVGGGAPVMPERPFTVSDLDTGERMAAAKVCADADVTDPALLDACTVDVAVSGSPEMAEIYGRLPAPRLVLKLVDEEPPAGEGLDVKERPGDGDPRAPGASACSFEAGGLPSIGGWFMVLAAAGAGALRHRQRRARR
jgi:hypothetical protein